jgi:IS5 family transposase
MLSGHKRGLSPQMKRELKRRSAVEATIGHMKTDGRLDRNFRKGHAINALLAAACHNMRLILNALAFLLAWILCAVRQTEETAKIDASPISDRYQISIA